MEPTFFVTEKAIEEFNQQLTKRKAENTNIRIGIAGSGGCKGFSYKIQFGDNAPKEKDIIFNFDSVKVIIDPKSMIYLNGCSLDFEKDLMKNGFVFKNPQEKSTCGCGKSFSI